MECGLPAKKLDHPIIKVWLVWETRPARKMAGPPRHDEYVMPPLLFQGGELIRELFKHALFLDIFVVTPGFVHRTIQRVDVETIAQLCKSDIS